MQYHEMERQFRHQGRSSGIGVHVRVQKMRWAGRLLDFFFCLVTAAMLVIGGTENDTGTKLLVRLNVSWIL
jgi:hypothetical protein